MTSSHTPPLLKELSETLSILSATRGRRQHVLLSVKPSHESSAVNDRSRDLAGERVLGDEDARILSRKLIYNVDDRLGHIYSTVNPIGVEADISDLSEQDKKKYRKCKQTHLLQCSALFDINECTLDFLPETVDKNIYYSMLYNAAISDLPDLLGNEYDPKTDYASCLSSIHTIIINEIKSVGRKETKEALNWWLTIENSTSTELRKRKLYYSLVHGAFFY